MAKKQKNKDATFDDLVQMCEKVGWDKGIASLEWVVSHNEKRQAALFGGSPDEVIEAQRLSELIIRQNITIGRLKKYRHDNNRD